VLKQEVGRGGGVLSGPASLFLAQRLSNSKFGVLNIAGAAVFPFIVDGTQAVLIDICEAITA